MGRTKIKMEINDKDKNNIYKKINNKNKTDINEENIIKKEKEDIKINNNLYPAYHTYGYRVSEYKSFSNTTDLSETDKFLIDKYDKYNNYRVDSDIFYNNYGFAKKLTYNYQTSEKENLNNKGKLLTSPKIYFNNNQSNNLNYLLKNDKENIEPKTYLEKNNIRINNIGKDINFTNIGINEDKLNITSQNDINNNSPFQKNITYSLSSSLNKIIIKIY